MKKNHILLCATFFLLAACTSMMQGGYDLPTVHPQQLGKGNPVCTDCHEATGDKIPFSRFNHTVYFLENHRVPASQAGKVCAICHQESFCSDCHATRVELKPSIKNQTDTYRRMPHRGDYLARHSLDGRTDPTSCIRCHGNPKTNTRCIPCHG